MIADYRENRFLDFWMAVCGRIGIRQAHRLIAQPIHVGRLQHWVAATREVAVALVIKECDNDIRTLLCLSGCGRRVGRSQQRKQRSEQCEPVYPGRCPFQNSVAMPLEELSCIINR